MTTQLGVREWSLKDWRGGFDLPGGSDEEVTGIETEEESLPEDYEEIMYGDPPMEEPMPIEDDVSSPEDYYFEDNYLDSYEVFPDDPELYV